MKKILKSAFLKIIILIELAFSFYFYCCAGIWWEFHKDLYEELDSYNIHTIAVLPARNSNLDSNEIKEANQYFMNGINKIMKQFTLVGPEVSIEKLNRDSLTEKYYKLFEDIYTSEKTLGKLINDAGKSIGCDAIVRFEISDFNEQKYFDQNKIITSCGVGYTLYSTKEGKHIWGYFVGSYINSDLKSGPSPFINVVKTGIDSLLLYTHN